MLTDQTPDAGTGFNYQEAIDYIRRSAANTGGYSQFSDDQIQFMIKHRSYYSSVKWAGADVTDSSEDPYAWGWCQLGSDDITKLAAEITAAGMPVDAATLLPILEAEASYANTKGLSEITLLNPEEV